MFSDHGKDTGLVQEVGRLRSRIRELEQVFRLQDQTAADQQDHYRSLYMRCPLPYQGFPESFYDKESPLSVEVDHCMCIEVIKGRLDPALPFVTQGGSFFMNGTTDFLATVSEQDKGQTRNVCNAYGYESVALIPIRDNETILGLVHVADTRLNRVPEMTRV